ncbi:hypothetical protein [Actinokineospora iranica]|uniref:Uncharacterized protein n=1 Tax=Actinokineospora iranica TaxID=1271860 RepID=A0A1G6RYV0_9PSEU|nr:hypothetical protein [Actinokineospora iranica]SDD09135.1 hypothetical protein SAMN05216174_10778 [Actinokineospora iranica]
MTISVPSLGSVPVVRSGARLIAVLVLALTLAMPSTAHADGGPIGADLHIAQTLGDRELTVVVRRADGAPAPVRVDVITHAGGPAGTLRLRLIPPGASPVSETTLALAADPGPHSATLRVDRFGAWELELSDGAHVARVPFTVPQRVTLAWESAAYGGFVAAGGFLLVALLLAARRSRLTLVPVAGVVVALSVALTAALLSPTIGVSTVEASRPAVNLAARPIGPAAAGQPVEVALRFTDSATGRVADDFLVHHNALVHLAVVSPGGHLAHLHPVRAAAGDYRVRFVPNEGGRHAMAAEVARLGGGVQLVRAAIEVTGPASAEPPAVLVGAEDGPGPRAPLESPAVRGGGSDVPGGSVSVGGPGADVPVGGGRTARVTVGAVRVGRPATLTVDFGGPADLQPWLGMRGHLIVLGPSPAETVWAHVHAMTPTTPGATGGQPDETVAAYDPRVEFTFTFPEPGRYRLWFQAERDYRVLTAPVMLDVPPAGEQR